MQNLTLPIFDIALVGAGPAAYAALCALSKSGKSVALITGENKLEGASVYKGPHAKITSASFERQRSAGLAETVEFPKGTALSASAEIGGLANYWGQQVQIYGPADPWTSAPTWEHYRDLCHSVEQDLHITGGERLGLLETENAALEVHTPRLLSGAPPDARSDLDAISTAIRTLTARMPNLHLFQTRVHTVEAASAGPVSLPLQDGCTLQASTVLLAAGVVGTAGILGRSLPSIQHCQFQDHLPYMLYTIGLSKILPRIPESKPVHFNALSLMRRKADDGACDIFASVYRMSQAPVSLVTASLGLGPWLRGWKIGALADLIRPVQVWTPSTVGTYQYQPRQNKIDAVSMADPALDPALSEFKASLRARGVRHKLSLTAPGQGFHYHGLNICGQDGSQHPVDNALKAVFGAQVICLDASALPQIGCQPHTLTSMAQALSRTRNVL